MEPVLAVVDILLSPALGFAPGNMVGSMRKHVVCQNNVALISGSMPKTPLLRDSRLLDVFEASAVVGDADRDHDSSPWRHADPTLAGANGTDMTP